MNFVIGCTIFVLITSTSSVTLEHCGGNESYPFEISRWHLESQHLPTERVFFASTIYNNSLFAIGDFDDDPISILSKLSLLNESYNESLWYETDWVFDSNYGNVTEVTCYNSFVAVGPKLYILAPGRDSVNDGEMYVYDLKEKEQINASTYRFNMPDRRWETPC